MRLCWDRHGSSEEGDIVSQAAESVAMGSTQKALDLPEGLIVGAGACKVVACPEEKGYNQVEAGRPGCLPILGERVWRMQSNAHY